MLAEPNRVGVVFMSRLVRNDRGHGTGFEGATSWRLGDSASRLAVTSGYVDISRRRPFECLAAITGRKQEDSHARKGELPGSVNR